MSNQSAFSNRPSKEQLIKAPLTIKQITLTILHDRVLGYGIRTGAVELLQEKSIGE